LLCNFELDNAAKFLTFRQIIMWGIKYISSPTS